MKNRRSSVHPALGGALLLCFSFCTVVRKSYAQQEKLVVKAMAQLSFCFDLLFENVLFLRAYMEISFIMSFKECHLEMYCSLTKMLKST